MARRPWAISALSLLLPCPALAQPVAASFTPPVDREIRFEVIETRHRQGNPLVFKLDQRARFAREGSGYRMTVTLHSAKADAPAAIAQRFDAAFRPFVGLETTLLLSHEGKPLGLADEAATWSRVLAAIEKLRAEAALKPAIANGIESVLASIAALPPEARSAKLMENLLRLVGYALPPVAPGDTVESGDAREGASATLKAVDHSTLTYTVRTSRQLQGNATLASDGELVVERATGLLLRSSTRERVVTGVRTAGDEPDAVIDVKRLQ